MSDEESANLDTLNLDSAKATRQLQLLSTKQSCLLPGQTINSDTKNVSRMGKRSVLMKEKITLAEMVDFKTSNKCKTCCYSVSRTVFHPDGRFVLGWSMFILLLSTTSAILVPLQVAQNANTDDEKSFVISLSLDALFLFDMIFRFHTGFKNGPHVEMRKKKIALNYLHFWFWLDLLAMCGYYPDSLKRNFDWVRLLRLLRIARFGRCLHTITTRMAVKSSSEATFKFFVYVTLLAHTIACCFIWVSEKTFGNDDGSWLSSKFDSYYSKGLSVSFSKKYIYAIYWAITTMTTIGYGDIGPKNDAETCFVVFAEVVGLAVFALLLTQINSFNDSLIPSADRRAMEAKDTILDYLNNHSMEKKLWRDTMNNFTFRAIEYDIALMKDLPMPDRMKTEIKVGTLMPALLQCSLFGWTDDYDDDMKNCRAVFHKFDGNNNDRLTVEEVKDLLIDINIHFDHNKFITLLTNNSSATDITFEHFFAWYYQVKNSRPFCKFPHCCITALACLLTPALLPPREVIVEQGQYGNRLFLLANFGCLEYSALNAATAFESHIARAQSRQCYASKKSKKGADEALPTQCFFDDTIAAVGLVACVDDKRFEQMRKLGGMEEFSVHSKDYAFVFQLDRSSLRKVIEKLFPFGNEDLVQVVAMHYGLHSLIDENALPVSLKYALAESLELAPKDDLDSIRVLIGPELFDSMNEPVVTESARLDRLETKFDKVLSTLTTLIRDSDPKPNQTPAGSRAVVSSAGAVATFMPTEAVATFMPKRGSRSKEVESRKRSNSPAPPRKMVPPKKA